MFGITYLRPDSESTPQSLDEEMCYQGLSLAGDRFYDPYVRRVLETVPKGITFEGVFASNSKTQPHGA